MKILGYFLIFFGLFGIFYEHEFIVGLVILALGVYLAFFRKKKQAPIEVQDEPKPEHLYSFKYLRIFDQDDAFNRRYRSEHKDEFMEDDDFHLSKKEMIEIYEGSKVYRYLWDPTECTIDGRNVRYHGQLIGHLAESDLPVLNEGFPTLIFYPNEYKDVSFDEIEHVKDDPYFMLRVTIQTK